MGAAMEIDAGIDAGQFEQLLRAHDQRLRGLAFRMLGDRAAMDDVLQEAYLKAWRGLGSFRGEAAIGTWLYRIVSSCCLDHLRRRTRRGEVALEEAPERMTAAIEALAGRLDLAAALDQLSPDHRLVVLLVDVDGFSYDDAAAILGVAPGTVASRLNRAHHALRLLLRKDGER